MAEISSDATPSRGDHGLWDRIELIARIASLVAIPVVLAIGGWVISSSLAERTVSQEYVKLAVTILREPNEKTEPHFRSWAAELLNLYSPVKFDAETLSALREGRTLLPASSIGLDTKTIGELLRSGPSPVEIGKVLGGDPSPPSPSPRLE